MAELKGSYEHHSTVGKKAVHTGRTTDSKRREQQHKAGRRNTYTYELKVGNKVVYMGHTTDLKRREQEHQKEFPNSSMVQIRRTTREAALQWERAKLDKVRIEPRELRKLSASTRTRLLKNKEKILKMLD